MEQFRAIVSEDGLTLINDFLICRPFEAQFDLI
jgi:hypothetical protein